MDSTKNSNKIKYANYFGFSYLVFEKAEVPEPILQLEYYSYCVADFGRTPIFSCLWRTARLYGIYLPATRTDPTPKLASVIGPRAYVHSLLGYAHDNVVEIDKLVDLDFPIMYTRTYANRSQNCLIIIILQL